MNDETPKTAAKQVITDATATKQFKQSRDPWQGRGNKQEAKATNTIEDRMLDNIDNMTMLRKFGPILEKLSNKDWTVEQFFNGTAPDVAAELLKLAMTDGSSKVRLEAIKDLLDRAGYAKVQKVAVANLDPNAPKEQLRAIAEGLMKKNVNDIEFIDDDTDK